MSSREHKAYGPAEEIDEEAALQRKIGVWGLSANIINSIVGAGIFVLPAAVAAGLGAASVLAYVACGLLVACIMLCFAEMGSRVPLSGGPYAYIEVAFGKYPGFLTAAVFIVAVLSADAALTNAVADILSKYIPQLSKAQYRWPFFAVMLGMLAWMNVRGVEKGIAFVKINTVAKLLPLVFLITAGWWGVSRENLTWPQDTPWKEIGAMSLLLFFAFQGGETGLNVAGEVRRPQRNIPRAVAISIASVFVLYVLLQTVAQGVLGAELVTYTASPLAEVGRSLLGPAGLTLLTVGAAVSVFGSLSGGVLSNPRIAFAAAQDRVLPWPLLAKVHRRFRTPAAAIVVYTALTFMLASWGAFKQLAVMSSAGILLIYLGVALSVIRLRRQQGSLQGGFTMPFGYFFPLASCVIIGYFLISLKAAELLATALTLLGLSAVYVLLKKLQGSA